MAFRYLIYSTGTTYATTIVRESATNNPGAFEASLYTDFVIPEIQPLYLWRVTGGTTVVPNTDANIGAYLLATAPPPQPEDDASVAYVTGLTSQKIDIVTGATGNLGTFNASGNLDDAGLTIAQLTGLTTYTFTGSGGTQVFENGNAITIYSTPPTGTTVAWGDITGTISAQTDLWDILTGITANKLDTSVFNAYTGVTQPVIDAAITGVTNLGTGTTLGLVSGRNITLKSISVLGGLSISGDANNLILSGGSTGGGTITGGTNGLGVDGANICLGGTLTTTTWVDTANNCLRLGDCVNDKAYIEIDPVNNCCVIMSATDGNSILTSYVDADAPEAGMSACDTGGGGWSQVIANPNNASISSICAGDSTCIDVQAANIFICGSAGFAGAQYDVDYSANFTNRSLVDKAYVTGLTANLLSTTIFNSYTGATQPVIDAALTGATNGLTATGRDVELGGALTKNTLIGTGTFALSANTASIHLQAVNGINIIDTDGVGGINIESDAGTISLIGNTNLGAERTKLEISETQMLITDSRTTPVGMQYAADYSASFTNESLITKRYADTIGAGLHVKKAVLVATTGNTVLSGLTTIDGIALSNGDRVLVKNQTSGETNGIYVASASTWSRATDYDGTPSGEVQNGDLIPVLSGDSQYNTLWVLVTPDPISIGVTDLDYTLFSSPHEMIPGVGISINGNVISVNGSALAGNSISWTGNTFNVDINSGTLATALGNKLNISDFNYFSGTTLPANYLTISAFNTFTGTTLPANYYNKTEINAYTGATDTRIITIENEISYISGVTDNKLNTSVFNAYTGATAPNEIFLIHTGGTSLNTILATAIEWDSVIVSGAAFNWTGSTEIQVLETGLYELSYNIPYNVSANNDIGVGGNIILNNSTVIDITAAAGMAARTGGAANIGLPTVILSLTANDVLTLATFRTQQSGTATSSLTGSILIKRKNTLQ